MPSSNESYTIMPAGSRMKQRCWKIRTKLEKVLIVATTIACVIIIILAILLGSKPANTTDEISKVCSTTICLNEAAKIAQYIDTEIDPCENFYDFACGNFLKNAHGDENFRFSNRLEAIGKREVLEVYMEPIGNNDHYMVKAAKKLFQTCINENGLEEANLKAIKLSMDEAGGWPVLDGDKWNESQFDWLKASFKLRKLGYHFSAFIDLVVEPQPDAYLLKVTFPDVFDYSSINFNKLEFMIETALAFGAADRSKVESEMKATYDFLVALQLEVHSHFSFGNSSIYTVGKFQQKYGAINWLQFLNNLTEPVLKIFKTDSVIFPPAPTLKSWIDLINGTSKRTQANYMMWVVVENVLQYLPDKYLNYNNAWKKQISLSEKCLERIHDKFAPNPIDILCDRKYLPKQKKQKLEKFNDGIKAELINVLEKTKGIEPEQKRRLVEKAKNITVVIGQPEDYFENKILSDVAVDMTKPKDDSFLSLIAQANRNRRSFLYGTVNNATNRMYEKWYIKGGASLPTYNAEDNVLYVSTITAENFIYDDTRPSYLNYGVLGVSIGQQLSILPTIDFGNHISSLNDSLQCIKDGQSDFKVSVDNFLALRVIQYALGAELSYSAYELAERDEPNIKLIGVNYSPKQLFWISTASILCEPVNRYSQMHSSVVAGMISGFIRNHPRFAVDFECKKGSKMKPYSKCELL